MTPLNKGQNTQNKQYKGFEASFTKKKEKDLYENDIRHIGGSSILQVVDKNLHIPDPYEIILRYFEHGNTNPVTFGTTKQFRTRWILIFIGILALTFLYTKNYPNIFEAIIGIIFSIILIESIMQAIYILNKNSKLGLLRLFSTFIVMTIIVILIGNIVYII